MNPATSKHTSHPTSKYGTPYTSSRPLLPAAAMAGFNHRFDKLGNVLPLELHGCGCSLCSRQQRAVRLFWEAK